MNKLKIALFAIAVGISNHSLSMESENRDLGKQLIIATDCNDLK